MAYGPAEQAAHRHPRAVQAFSRARGRGILAEARAAGGTGSIAIQLSGAHQGRPAALQHEFRSLLRLDGEDAVLLGRRLSQPRGCVLAGEVSEDVWHSLLPAPSPVHSRRDKPS